MKKIIDRGGGGSGKIIFMRGGAYGLPPTKWECLMNCLSYWAVIENKVWAKISLYALNWLEQRSFDASCLLGKHFYINSETECERCGHTIPERREI